MHKGNFDDWHACSRMMHTQFGKPIGWSVCRYNGQDSLDAHLSHWVQEYDKQPTWMHMNFEMGKTINKHVLGGQMHKQILKLEGKNVERTSAQKVIHVEAFNKVYKALNKVCNTQRSDWDLHVPAVLWDYSVMCKKLMEQTPSRLAYEASTEISMKYIMPILRIAAPPDTTNHRVLEEGMAQLKEEECFGPDEGIQ